ncbi:hypothetical protein B0J17DRAFT_709395 [Rhizoctonia solani]|nr:hypothetical protein B0J17DRAFT_709395 [Rhizoctonia solani]
MLAFSRLTSILLFVLSLSYLTCAAPTIGKPQALAARGDDAGCTRSSITSAVDAEVLVTVITKELKVVADACVKVGANVNVSAEVKGKIAAELALIVKLIQICASLITKRGATVALSLCVQIDAMAKLLLILVDACVSGVVALCVKLMVGVSIKVLLKLNLDLCAQVLGLVKIKVSGAVGVAL